MSLVSLLASKYKAVYGATAEVIGMVMAQMEEANDVRMFLSIAMITFSIFIYIYPELPGAFSRGGG